MASEQIGDKFVSADKLKLWRISNRYAPTTTALMTESSNVSRLIGYNDHKNRDIKLKLIHPPCILRAETSRRKEYDDAIKRANEAIDLFAVSYTHLTLPTKA